MIGLSELGIMPLWAIPVWYALPLIVAISLVHGATRHEMMRPILISALKFGGWVVVFMIGLYIVLRLLSQAL
ncbi:MAG: hypothetical protein U0795_05425 [Pirellulales bacterium]